MLGGESGEKEELVGVFKSTEPLPEHFYKDFACIQSCNCGHVPFIP